MATTLQDNGEPGPEFFNGDELISGKVVRLSPSSLRRIVSLIFSFAGSHKLIEFQLRTGRYFSHPKDDHKSFFL